MDRYEVFETAGGFFVYDHAKGEVGDEVYDLRIHADAVAHRLNRRSRVRESIIENLRDEWQKAEQSTEAEQRTEAERLADLVNRVGRVAEVVAGGEIVGQELIKVMVLCGHWLEREDETQ